MLLPVRACDTVLPVCEEHLGRRMCHGMCCTACSRTARCGARLQVAEELADVLLGDPVWQVPQKNLVRRVEGGPCSCCSPGWGGASARGTAAELCLLVFRQLPERELRHCVTSERRPTSAWEGTLPRDDKSMSVQSRRTHETAYDTST